MLLLKLSVFAFAVCFAESGPPKGAPVLTKEQKEYYEKTSKLITLTNRINEYEKEFKELVHHKAVEKSKAEKQKILDRMLEVSKMRNKDVANYNRIHSDLTYRFPNQGEQLGRRYQTQNKKSVEELEGVAGLDEMLTRTKKIVEKKYAPFADPDDPKAQQAAAPDHVDGAGEDGKPKRLRLEK